MTNTDAVNTAGAMAFRYPPLIAVLGPASGIAPQRPDLPLADPVTAGGDDVLTETGYHATKVVQSAGGSVLDYCELQLDLDAPLENQVQPDSFSRMMEISLPNATAAPIFRGDLSSERHEVTPLGETLRSTAQLRGYHFGSVCRGQLWYDPVAAAAASGSGSGSGSGAACADQLVDHAITFNPTIDAKRLPNRSSKKRCDGNDAYLWIHPEAALTTYAQAFCDQTPASWTLLEAVLAICWLLNPDEEFVTNPTRAELTASLTDAAFDIVDNVTLPNGHYLPWYLDQLLKPVGYNWFAEYSLDGGSTVHKIVCFKRGAGRSRELFLQPVGAVLTLAESNTNQFDITRTIGEAMNRVAVRGELQIREITLELQRAWPESDDGLTAGELDSSDPDSQYVGKEKVWRMWVGNEAGDVTGLRTSVHPAGDPPDFSSLFDVWIPHRTEIRDCLSHYGGDESKERQPPFVEYSTDAGATWQPVPAEFGDAQLLQDQIGINFSRKGEPPAELIAAGDDARVRVTGTIMGDSRIEYVAERQSHAVNGRVVSLHKEMGQKFIDSAVQTTGAFASVISSGGGSGAENHDAEIQTFAEQLRDEYEAADMDCSFRLCGWHVGYYAIGDLLTNVQGREISLNRASNTAPAAKYPQVVEIETGVDARGPYTILRVDRNAR